MGDPDSYVPGEEETGDVPANNTPDEEQTEADDLPNGDLANTGKAASYELANGYLTVDADSFATMTATATIYATKPELEVEYKYDAGGLRIQKTVKATDAITTTDYILHGKLLSHQTVTITMANGTSSTDQPHFFYDKDSRPAMFEHTDAGGTKTLYHYVQNLQGDIIQIVDINGSAVVEYSYDAWGNPTDDTGSLTTEQKKLYDLNPFRYRGYVWDDETEMYYLRSRYYKPEWGRFLNADSQISVGIPSISLNVFTYVNNCHVNLHDPNGKESEISNKPYLLQGDANSIVDKFKFFSDIFKRNFIKTMNEYRRNYHINFFPFPVYKMSKPSKIAKVMRKEDNVRIDNASLVKTWDFIDSLSVVSGSIGDIVSYLSCAFSYGRFQISSDAVAHSIDYLAALMGERPSEYTTYKVIQTMVVYGYEKYPNEYVTASYQYTLPSSGGSMKVTVGRSTSLGDIFGKEIDLLW